MSGETYTVHDHTWAFATTRCARCGSTCWDPDQLHCETCTQMLGIQIAEEAGHL